jgi:hypothetical protein
VPRPGISEHARERYAPPRRIATIPDGGWSSGERQGVATCSFSSRRRSPTAPASPRASRSSRSSSSTMRRASASRSRRARACDVPASIRCDHAVNHSSLPRQLGARERVGARGADSETAARPSAAGRRARRPARASIRAPAVPASRAAQAGGTFSSISRPVSRGRPHAISPSPSWQSLKGRSCSHEPCAIPNPSTWPEPWPQPPSTTH